MSVKASKDKDSILADVKELLKILIPRYVDNFVASVNSYTGMLKNRTDYQRMVSLIKMIDDEWWRYVHWNASRQCVAVYEKYKEAERLNRKYKLNLKKKKNYEKGKFQENRDQEH